MKVMVTMEARSKNAEKGNCGGRNSQELRNALL